MKKIILFSVTIIFGVSLNSMATGLRMNLRSRVYSNLVEGATTYSILEEGNFNTHDISLNYSGSYENSSFSGGVRARASNDRAAYRDEFNINRWFAGFESYSGGLEYGLAVGDVYAGFSDLVFSRSVTGALGQAGIGGFNFQPVYGIQHSASEDSRYRRDSMGFRASQEITGDWEAGFSYAVTRDDEDSMDDDNDIIPLEENTIYGFDLGGSLTENLFFHYSRASSDYRESLSDTDAEDSAYKLRGDYRTRDFNFSGEYSVAGSEFNSLSGYSDRDRKVTALNAGYRFGRRANARLSYERYNNNLDDRLEYTTFVSAPRVRTDIRLLEDLIMNVDLRSRNIESDDTRTTVDRKFSSRGGGVRYSLGTTNLGLNYTRSKNTDENDSNNDYNSDALSLSGSGSYTLKEGAVRLSPALSYRRTKRERGTGDTDKSSGYNLSFNSRFTGTGTVGLTHSKNSRDGGTTNTRNSVRVSYFIAGHTGRTIELEYSVRDNDSGEDDTSYTDKFFQAGMNVRF